MRRIALLLALALAAPAAAQDADPVATYIQEAQDVRQVQLNRVNGARDLAGSRVAASNYSGVAGMVPGGSDEADGQSPALVEQATGGGDDGNDDGTRTPPGWAFAFLLGSGVLFLWQRRRHNAHPRPR